MDCGKFAEILDRYADLSADEIDELNDHADNCEKCADELSFMRSIIYTVGSLPPIEPPADFLDTLNVRLDNELSKEKRLKRFMRKSAPYIRKYGSIAACLAVGITIGMNADTLVSHMNGNDDGVISSTVSYSTDAPVVSDTNDIAVVTTAAPSAASPNFAPVQTPALSAKSKPNVTMPPIPNAATAQPSLQAKTPAASAKNTQSAPAIKPQYTVPSSANTRTVYSAPIGTATATNAPIADDVKPVPAADDTTAKPAFDEATAKPAPAVANNMSTPDTAASLNARAMPASETSDDGIAAYADVPAPVRIAPNVNPTQITDTPPAYSVVRVNEDDSEQYAVLQDLSEDTSDYSIVSPQPETVEAYAPLSSTIVVKAEDADRVKEIVAVFINGTYGNYYMITAKDMNTMLGQLDRENIWYNANITDSGDKVSFKLVVA